MISFIPFLLEPREEISSRKLLEFLHFLIWLLYQEGILYLDHYIELFREEVVYLGTRYRYLAMDYIIATYDKSP